MTYISLADDSWWEEEKLDDEADLADMKGSDGVQPMPPPNINVDTYDQRYGSFQTRFGEVVDEEKSKVDEDEKKKDVPAKMVEFSVWIFSLALLVLLVIVIRHYYLKKRRERVSM